MDTLLRRNDQVIPQHRNQMLCDRDFGCYVEEYFHELLTFERRRSERSGRPFLVMTLDFSGIRDLESRHESVMWSMKSLSVLTRDTDIKGWYRNPAVLGVTD